MCDGAWKGEGTTTTIHHHPPPTIYHPLPITHHPPPTAHHIKKKLLTTTWDVPVTYSTSSPTLNRLSHPIVAFNLFSDVAKISDNFSSPHNNVTIFEFLATTRQFFGCATLSRCSENCLERPALGCALHQQDTAGS